MTWEWVGGKSTFFCLDKCVWINVLVPKELTHVETWVAQFIHGGLEGKGASTAIALGEEMGWLQVGRYAVRNGCLQRYRSRSPNTNDVQTHCDVFFFFFLR